jgi:hypothetical protein
MRGVTTGAPSFGHRLMYDPGIFYMFYHFLGFVPVAVDTEGKFVFLKKVFGCVGAVRVMTADAALIFNYFM